jgi:tungstate transport system substrate-binding protein
MDALAAEYETATGVELSVLGESSQRLFDLGRRGEVEVVLTHEPEALAAFVADGYSAMSAAVIASRFLLAGPPELVDTLSGTDAASVFAEIATRELPFVSRADGSGTYRQELSFWALAGIEPSGRAWYDTTGQGMGLTMQVAAQRGAFVVVEEGAWLEAAPNLSLEIVPLPGAWPNTYTATVVAGSSAGAEDFFRWLLSADGEAAMAVVNERIFGGIVYRQAEE